MIWCMYVYIYRGSICCFLADIWAVVFSWIRKVHRSCHHPCSVTSAEHCCHELLAASRYCQPRQYNFAVQLCLVCHQFSLWTFQHCDFLVLRCTGRVFHFVVHCQRSCCVRTSGAAVSHGFRQIHRCKPWRLMHQISLPWVFHRPYRSLYSTSTDCHICGLWMGGIWRWAFGRSWCSQQVF